MTGNSHIRPTIESVHGVSESPELAMENGFLRAIVAELLIKNQALRWALLGQVPLGQGAELLAVESTRITIPGS